MAFTTLPTYLSGKVPTADDWTSVFSGITEQRPLSARKLADETVNNSSTLQNDDDLFLSVAASTVYRLTAVFRFNGNSTADIKTGWTYPTGTTLRYTATGVNIGGSLVSPTLIETDVPGYGAGGLSGTSDDSVTLNGLVIVSTTAGVLQLQWSQNAANASNTIMRAGSFITLDPLDS